MSFNDKHIESLDAANILLEKKKYNGVPHCTYYAVFQYMKYILKANFNEEYQNYISFIEAKQGNSHVELIRKIKSKLNVRTRNYFNKQYGILKKKRLKGDYDEQLIKESEARISIDIGKELINLLKRHFG